MSMGFPFVPHEWSKPAPETSAAGSEARAARSEVGVLRAEVERLFLLCEALWTVVKRQQGLRDEDLAELVRVIDLEDGRRDGRKTVRARPKPCPACGRVLSRLRPLCIYCGAEVATDPFGR